MCVCFCECDCVCVSDNSNVGKRARNYRKKHLSCGKIIKSTHTFTSENPSPLPVVVRKNPWGQKINSSLFFRQQTRGKSLVEARQAENWKFPTAKPLGERSICIWFSADIFRRFSDIFHRGADCCYFCCEAAGATPRRLPEKKPPRVKTRTGLGKA